MNTFVVLTNRSVFTVANYFLHKSEESGRPITPMQMVKLAYIAHGWYLGLTGKPLFAERAEAWKYGPVIPPLYHAYKVYGNSPIAPSAKLFGGDPSDELKLFLDRVWNVYSVYSGPELSAMTHQRNTPWWQVWHDHGGSLKRGAVIPDDLIKRHYEELAAAQA
ncbi:MAG: DUF4065 domain-containing protein [Luteolibacter sp.]